MKDDTRTSPDELEERFEEGHRHPINRALHLIGVPIIASGVVALFFYPGFGIALIAFGYGLNFLGHAIEGSVPALFRDPRSVWIGAKHFGRQLASIFR